MKNKDNVFFLLNIAEACKDILAYASVKYETFLNDKMRQDAIIRKFEILGEATKNLTEDFRVCHPSIDWKGMAGLRDILIHQYFGIDLAIVWSIAQKDIPFIYEQINSMKEYQQTILKLNQDND